MSKIPVRSSKKVEIEVTYSRTNRTNQINELRQKQKELIGNLKYEEAKELQNQINKIKSEGAKDELTIIKNQFTDEFNAAVDKYLEEEKQREENNKDDLIKFKRQTSRNFEALKKRQKRELSLLEKKLASDRLLEHERTIPEQVKLIERSRQAAESGDFDEAVRLRDQSKIVAKQSIESRLVKLNSEFNESREGLIKQFADEIGQFTRRYQYDTNTLKDKQAANAKKAEENRDAALSTICSKYMKIATTTVKGEEGARGASEVQNMYIELCNKYGFSVFSFQTEQQLDNGCKFGKTKKPTSSRPSTRAASRVRNV